MCGFYHDDFRCVTGYGQWRSVCLRALRGDVWDVPHPRAAGGREFGAECDDEFSQGGLAQVQSQDLTALTGAINGVIAANFISFTILNIK